MAVECPKCHQTNQDSDDICSFCGAALTIPVYPTQGLSFWQSNEADAKRPEDSDPGEGAEREEGEGKEPDEAEQAMAYLEVEGGQEIFYRGSYTTKVPIKNGSILVGRRDVMASHYPDIDLMMYRKLDPAISRRHLRFFSENGKYYVEDLCNNNATFLNDYGNKLNHERRELCHGDRIFVSMSLAFLFRLHE